MQQPYWILVYMYTDNIEQEKNVGSFCESAADIISQKWEKDF